MPQPELFKIQTRGHVPRRIRRHIPYHIVVKRAPQLASLRANVKTVATLLRATQKRYPEVAVHEVSVMHSHVHLLMTTRVPHLLSRFLQFFCSRIALAINQKLHRRGTFWLQRYFHVGIDNRRRLRHVIRYIRQNPQVAGLCVAMGKDPWATPHPRANEIFQVQPLAAWLTRML